MPAPTRRPRPARSPTGRSPRARRPGAAGPGRTRRLPTDAPRSALGALAVVAALALAAACDGPSAAASGGEGEDEVPVSAGQPGATVDDLPAGALEVMAEDLDTPWEIRFLPDGDLLVTERTGRLLRLTRADGGDGPAYRIVERHEIQGVREAGEGGLMGLALHPDFPTPPRIYLCHTLEGGSGLQNRVVRYRYADGALGGREVLVGDVPGAAVHDGCRLEFGPDGFLFVTSGDAAEAGNARERGSLAGKIHRVGPDGAIPQDNPFGSPVWSLGHRNPQGLAFDSRGRLWSTEHGPSGMSSGRDEVNLIRRGENYGWPEITGGERREGMNAPELHSGSSTWAPAGLAHRDGRLYFGGLRGAALFEARGLAGEGEVRLLAHFRDEFGRIRPVRVGPEGRVWFGTSNRDGRGSPAGDDDRLIAVDPGALGGG